MPADEKLSRRGAFGRLAAAFGAGAAAWAATRPAVAAASAGTMRVAYHLSDPDKVTFVLGNIRNHIDGVGGPQNIHIVLVVHGPALSAFEASKANPDLARKLADAAGQGVELDACGNTMKGMKLELADLLPGFVRVDQGGVTRLAELQVQGYAYLRP